MAISEARMNIIEELHRGNTRANRDRIATSVGVDPRRFAVLMDIYLNGDKREAQLAAGVLFCCIEDHPELFRPWIAKVIQRMDEPDVHPAVRRVAVRALRDTDLPKSLQGRVVDICFRYLSDPSEPIAIRVFSMGAIARIAESEPDLWNELDQVIQAHLPHSSGGFKSHARQVGNRMKKAKHRMKLQ